MKYSVLKQLANERQLKTNDKPATVPREDVQGLSTRYHEKKTRRFRSAFTTDQIKYLEKQFQKFPYIESGSRRAIASVLNIPERTVKFWFQNRRMKEKKESLIKDLVGEGQSKINGNLIDDKMDVKTFNYQSHSGHLSYQLKPILVCPDKTDSSSSNVINCSKEFSKSVHEKQSIEGRNLENVKILQSNLIKAEPTHINGTTNVNLLRKNICGTKLPTRNMPVNQKLKNIKAKDRNPMDYKLKSSSNPEVCQQYYYQIPNDQSYAAFRVNPLIQHPSAPGNIVWRPVNTLSVVPNIINPSQMMAYDNRYLPLKQNLPKDQCKCNCKINNTQEMSPYIPYNDIKCLRKQQRNLYR
ncbi:homeobox protein ceh-8-like [Danaus plexippus]|uniref:homeobox protein ceh-8-like n=1 Tax=Danaus plexippus TaxID=13037 RepID=UPI002AAF7EF5|nr:homeobox protein ceh-8-like [Danaus plexippus]